MAINDPRTQIERHYLGQLSLTAGAVAKPTNFELPLGELWYEMLLSFSMVATVGASPVGATAFTEALALELIHNVQIETDRDGLVVDAPLKALFHRAWMLRGVKPNISDGSFAANTAAAYTLTAEVPILFADPRLMRPEDTALATDRYSRVNLSINCADGGSILSTAHSSGGGITLSAMTCDVEVKALSGKIPDGARPVVVQKFQNEGGPIDSSASTRVNLSRSKSRALKRLFTYASNLGVSARAWSGNGHNTILSTMDIKAGNRAFEGSRRAAMIRGDNKVRFGIESYPAGLHVVDFAEDGSVWSSLSTGDLSELYAQIAEVSSGAPSGNRRFAVCADAVEELGA